MADGNRLRRRRQETLRTRRAKSKKIRTFCMSKGGGHYAVINGMLRISFGLSSGNLLAYLSRSDRRGGSADWNKMGDHTKAVNKIETTMDAARLRTR